jgi:ABC-type polysaccharide/polyol phosphate transport system ATPase subunit
VAKITLRGVTVSYPVVVANRQQSALAAAARGVSFGRIGRGGDATYITALRSLSLDVGLGARVGLVGRNGSGKSTLLRTLAGIITPQAGRIEVQGSIACLLSLGAGLDPDKSGYDNLKLIGRLHGMQGKELREAVEEAGDFSELGSFLNMPVRSYSAGMATRLSFAIATSRHADIMLIDEVIGAGDTHFIGKAVQRVRELCAQSGIVVVASHAPDILHTFCDEAILMNAGEVLHRGPVDEVLAAYDQAA